MDQHNDSISGSGGGVLRRTGAPANNVQQWGAVIYSDGEHFGPILDGNRVHQGNLCQSGRRQPLRSTNVYFWIGYWGDATLTFYDINNNVIGTPQIIKYSQPSPFSIPAKIHAFSFVPRDVTGGNGVCLYNLSYQNKFEIIKPIKGKDFPLSQDSWTKTENIEFQANSPLDSGQVDWSVKLFYKTSGGTYSYTAYDYPTSLLNAPITRTYPCQPPIGGQMEVNAKKHASGEMAAPVKYAYVIGTQIPNSEITSRLLGLYQEGPTPDLLAKIAQKESSYAQFADKNILDFFGRWPVENYRTSKAKPGDYIGLMQVRTTPEDAWNWKVNTESGKKMLDVKKSDAVRVAKKRYLSKGHWQRLNLPNMSLKQVEDWAIALYGNYGKPYYIPKQMGKTAYWIVNPNNQAAVKYVKEIREIKIPN